MFQSRRSLLARPLIRLSVFKPSLGEDKIEFAGDKDGGKEQGVGGMVQGEEPHTCAFTHPPQQGESEAAQEVAGWHDTGVFFLLFLSLASRARVSLSLTN